jgi:hypothetical protein
MFPALEDLDAEMEINSAWEMIRENIKISVKASLGYCKLRKHKPFFHDGCLKLLLKLLYQRKPSKLQWLQNPSEINEDNLSDRHFRNKQKEYLKDKINELPMKVRTRT